MFHPAIAAAMAQERHTQLIKAASRRRTLRAAKATGAHAGRRGQ